MKIHFEELSREVGQTRTVYYYLATEKLITSEELESRLAEIETVQSGLDAMIERFGPVYTSPTHIEK